MQIFICYKFLFIKIYKYIFPLHYDSVQFFFIDNFKFSLGTMLICVFYIVVCCIDLFMIVFQILLLLSVNIQCKINCILFSRVYKFFNIFWNNIFLLLLLFDIKIIFLIIFVYLCITIIIKGLRHHLDFGKIVDLQFYIFILQNENGIYTYKFV